MTYEELLTKDASESVKDAVADYLLKQELKKLEAKQMKFEKFIEGFDDFMRNI